MVYSTDCSKAVVPVLVLLFVALWFILRGDLFYVLPCVILFLCFSVLLALRLLHLGKRELILVLFVRLIDLRLFGFVCFLFLLVSGKGCGFFFFFCKTLKCSNFYCLFDFVCNDVFARRFVSNETILLRLTISNQKPFVLSVSVFCSQILANGKKLA